MSTPTPDTARARLIAELRTLIGEMREAAADHRLYTGVPCQSESSWHAETFESWAQRIERQVDLLADSGCTWREDQDGLWEPSCGQGGPFCVESDPPHAWMDPPHAWMQCCCYCGHPVTLIAYTAPIESDEDDDARPSPPGGGR